MAWTISRAMGMSVLYENFLLHDWLSRARVTSRNSSDSLYRERFVVHWRFALANACHPANGVSLRFDHLVVVKGEFPWPGSPRLPFGVAIRRGMGSYPWRRACIDDLLWL